MLWLVHATPKTRSARIGLDGASFDFSRAAVDLDRRRAVVHAPAPTPASATSAGRLSRARAGQHHRESRRDIRVSARTAASPDSPPPYVEDTVSVTEAARLLGRHRTRVYALIGSGDLVAVPATDDAAGPLQVDRASLERWLTAGSGGGVPLSPRDAARHSRERRAAPRGQRARWRADQAARRLGPFWRWPAATPPSALTSPPGSLPGNSPGPGSDSRPGAYSRLRSGYASAG
jgi:hypothetical protein